MVCFILITLISNQTGAIVITIDNPCESSRIKDWIQFLIINWYKRAKERIALRKANEKDK